MGTPFFLNLNFSLKHFLLRLLFFLLFCSSSFAFTLNCSEFLEDSPLKRVQSHIEAELSFTKLKLSQDLRDSSYPIRNYQDIQTYLLRLDYLREFIEHARQKLLSIETQPPKSSPTDSPLFWGFKIPRLFTTQHTLPTENQAQFTQKEISHFLAPFLQEIDDLEEKIYLAPYKSAENWLRTLYDEFRFLKSDPDLHFVFTQAFMKTSVKLTNFVEQVYKLAPLIKSFYRQFTLQQSLIIASYFTLLKSSNTQAYLTGALIGKISQVISENKNKRHDSFYLTAQVINSFLNSESNLLYETQHTANKMTEVPHHATGEIRNPVHHHFLALGLIEAGLEENTAALTKLLQIYDKLSWTYTGFSHIAANMALDITLQIFAPHYVKRRYKYSEILEHEIKVTFP